MIYNYAFYIKFICVCVKNSKKEEVKKIYFEVYVWVF